MPKNKSASKAIEQMKYEIANEYGIPYDTHTGYNGHLTTQQAGKLGGSIVKRLVALAEEQVSKGKQG